MIETYGAAPDVVAAVRETGPGGLLSRRNLVVNGGFDSSLSPWTSSTGDYGAAFVASNGNASALFALNPIRPRQRVKRSHVRSIILSLTENYADPLMEDSPYFMSLDLGILKSQSSSVSCQFIIYDGIGDTFYSQFVPNVLTSVRTIYGSGTTTSGSITQLLFYVQCSGSVDITVSLDNAFFGIFPYSAGTGICTPSGQVLQNSGFDSVFTPWVTSQGSAVSASFSIDNNRALVSFDVGRGTGDDPARLAQALVIRPSPTYPSYHLYAYLRFERTAGSCSVNFRTDVDQIYNTGQITTTRFLEVNYRGSFGISSDEFWVVLDCYPGGDARIYVDTVALYIDPDPDCRPA